MTGLIDAFVNISTQGGYSSSNDISGGIYQSLLTTAAGLVVAIPSAVAYSYLSARVNTLMHDMERGGIEIVHMISEKGGKPRKAVKSKARRSSISAPRTSAISPRSNFQAP